MAIPIGNRKFVTCNCIALNLSGHRKTRSGWCKQFIARRGAIKGCVGYLTKIALALCIIIAESSVQAEPASTKASVHFEAANARNTSVADFGEAVRTQERQLDVIPIFLEYGAVPTERTECGFPTEFIIVELVRTIRWQGAATVDPARTETTRPCGIDQNIVGNFVSCVQLMNETRVRR